MENKEKYFEWLLANRDIDDLNASEKELIENGIGIDEYQSLLKTSMISKAMLKEDELKPKEDIYNKLSSHFDDISRSRKTPVLLRIIRYRVPSYAAAIAAIIIFTLGYFNSPFFSLGETVYLKPDTVYVDREVVKYVDPASELEKPETRDTEFQEVTDKERIYLKRNMVSSAKTVPLGPDLYSGNAITNMMLTKRKNKGYSLDEDTLASKFLVACH